MIERRHGTGGGLEEVRARKGEVVIRGYAALFDVEATIGGAFREVVAEGAFAKALARDDVPLLLQHTGTSLARNRSGTLTLAEDSKGLLIEASLDLSNPDAQTAISALRRGDIDQMSFAFSASIQDWLDDDQRLPLRILREISLYDVSLVNLAAYPETSVAVVVA